MVKFGAWNGCQNVPNTGLPQLAVKPWLIRAGLKSDWFPDAPLKFLEDIRDKYELGKVLGSGSFGQAVAHSARETQIACWCERRREYGMTPEKAIQLVVSVFRESPG